MGTSRVHALSGLLSTFGFTSCVVDPVVLIKKTQGDLGILVIYVDDIILTGSDDTGIFNLSSFRAQNSARNDPIYHRIKALHSAFQKTKIWSSSSEFFLFSQQNLDFKHSLDAKMSLKEKENKRFKD